METFTRFGEYSILSKKHFGRALGQKKVVLFPEIGRVKLFLSFTRLYSGMCIRIYIFNFKKQQTNNKKTRVKKAKETKEEKRISPENRLKKKKFAAAWVKIFLFTLISGNKSIIFFGLNTNAITV